MRVLSPAEFGAFAVAMATIGLVIALLSPRLGILVIRARDAEYTEIFKIRLNSAITIESVGCLIAAIACLIFTRTADFWSLLLATTLATGHWLNSVTMFYERNLPYQGIAALEATSQLIGHAVAIILALAGCGIISLYLREAVVVLLRGVLLARLGAIPRWRVCWVSIAEWRALLTEARVPWLDGVIDGAFQRCVVLAINGLLGLHGAGLFSQAYRLALVPHQILSPVVVRLAGNVFSRMESTTERRRTFLRVLAIVSVPLAIAAMLAWLLGELIVPVIFGPNWIDAGPVFAAMAGIIFSFSTFELARSYCLAQRLHRLLLLGRSVQYICFAVGCLWVWQQANAVQLATVLSGTTVLSAITLLLGLAILRGKG